MSFELETRKEREALIMAYAEKLKKKGNKEE